EGTTETVEDFVVLRAPIISDFIPKRGTKNSEIVIVGENFTHVTEVAFGGLTENDFVVESNSRIRVVVPDSANTGKIRVTNLEGSTISSDDFVVLLPPTITSFAPIEGAAGTWLTIAGTNFDDSTKVAFHDSVMAAVQWDSTSQIRARVPEQARTGTIRVINGTLAAESLEPFVVLKPPSILAFSPLEGPIGTMVTLRGRNLETTTFVTFNDMEADSLKIVSGDEIQAMVPDSTTTGIISVTNPDGTATSEKAFTVAYPPTINSFEPAKAKVGSRVTLLGTNFETAKELVFNDVADTSFVILSSLKMEATVPEDATTGPIRVVNAAGSFTSSNDFVVEPDLVPVASIFKASQDSYVRSSMPQKSFGSMSELRVRNTVAVERRTYLKFNVTGLSGEVQSAKLRLLMTNLSVDPGSVYLVSNRFRESPEPWTEEELSWENAPEIVGPALSSVDSVTTFQIVDFELSSTVKTDGIYSFAIKNSSADMAIYSSKEGVFAPEMEVISLEPAVNNPPQIRAFWPQFGNPGDQISILGSGFGNSDEVSVNGIPATFSAVSTTIIQATIPTHAASGKLRVRNAIGEAVTTDTFAVGEPERSFTLLPADDAYVRSIKPLKNYGTFADLTVRETSSAKYVTFFKFEISGLVKDPTAAVLKLFVTDPGVDGGTVHVASNMFHSSSIPWNEDELNWGNAPEIQSTTIAEIGNVYGRDSIMVDLSSFIHGNGTLTLALQSGSSDAVKYGSKEGIKPPQLWIHTRRSATGSEVGAQPLENLAPAPHRIPVKFGLSQNYPNPFNAATIIEYALPKDSKIQLTVFNLLGQPVRTLIDGVQKAGFKRIKWNGLAKTGRELTSGIYFIQLQTPNQRITRKVILQK
ncbi:DNRLRE domain-containing protein, partial [bacterium]|nr:DNRLRE domain-containing protein [bacterium]